jgi:hypothetical protein
MAHPANTGWQGGAPILMAHDYDGYKALPLAKISTTSFSFEENAIEEYTITNLHTGPITFSFKAESVEAVNSCFIKPAKGSLEAGQSIHGTVSAKGVVDTSQQWEMKLMFAEGKREQEIEIVINRSKRDLIKAKTSKLGASSTSSSTPPTSTERRQPDTKQPAASPPSAVVSKPSSDRAVDRTVDFTFIVMFAITLSLIFIIHDIVKLPFLCHPALVAFISFVLGAMTFAYSGPFKEWLGTFTTKSKVKKP